MKYGKIRFVSIVTALLCHVLAAQATPLTPGEDFGFKTYFKHHEPKEKIVKYNFYPFSDSIIPFGKDIPVCALARTPAPYLKKSAMRYILHGKDGWLFRTIDFRSDFTPSAPTLEYFERLNRLLSAKGQALIVAFQPPRAMASEKHFDPTDVPAGYSADKARKGYEAFLQQLNGIGIVAPDLSEHLKDISYFPKGDFHWTPEGAGYTARQMAAALKEIPAYDDIAKQDFESKTSGIGPAGRGAFEEFIQNTCHANVELTSQPIWTTWVKTKEKVDASALLGDTPFPAVTVLGTSNSSEDDKFNFVGALKHFSRTDMYNAAITGGGFGSSAYRYYASNEYHAHPPKIILWEFLPQHNYNNDEAMVSFRQMIPAVIGACSSKDALAEYSDDIKSSQTQIFSHIKDIPLRNTYLYLDVVNPRERNLKLEVLYKDGEVDQVDLSRTTRAANNGKYFFEISHDTDKSALFFHAITNTLQGHLTARICRYPNHVAEK